VDSWARRCVFQASFQRSYILQLEGGAVKQTNTYAYRPYGKYLQRLFQRKSRHQSIKSHKKLRVVQITSVASMRVLVGSSRRRGAGQVGDSGLSCPVAGDSGSGVRDS